MEPAAVGRRLKVKSRSITWALLFYVYQRENEDAELKRWYGDTRYEGDLTPLTLSVRWPGAAASVVHSTLGAVVS